MEQSYPLKSIVSVQAIEASIFDLLKRRDECTQVLPNDLVLRIHRVRDICKNAEAKEGNCQIAWRRNPHSGNDNRQSSKHAHGISNRWRGGSPGSSQDKPKTVNTARYVSKFTNSETPVEDKILNQVILNKLNKFSLSNYNDIKEFLEQILDNNETEFLHNFIQLVFKKAATEPTFCPLYAKMISELSMKYSCFKKELFDIYEKYITIFDEITEDQCENYEQYVQRNREKIHRHGYSQFLGELTSLDVLEFGQLEGLYIKILEQIKQVSNRGDDKVNLVEEYVSCLLCMTKAFQKDTNYNLKSIRTRLGETCEPILEELLTNRTSKYPGLSKKASFAIMDCLDIFRSSVP
jgi:hypothetical protein